MSFEDSSGGDGLDELRRRLTDRALSTKRPDEMSLQDLMLYIERLVHLAHVRMDGFMPGGNDKAHYEHHAKIESDGIRSAIFWHDVRVKITTGLIIGIGVVVGAASAFLVYELLIRR